MKRIKSFLLAIVCVITDKNKDNHHKQLADDPIDRIIFSDDLEKYRQANGFLNDKGNEIFCKRVNDYLDKLEENKNGRV